MNKKLIIGGIVIAMLVLLLSWGKLFGDKTVTYWGDTQIACLPNGHADVALHIHQNLKIFADGVEEPIPANIGVSPSCMAEVHTHDVTGQLHIETTETGKSYTLGDFFAVWNKSLERDGYALSVTVNGELNEDPGKFPLKDHMEIVLTYTPDATSTPQ